MAIKVGGTTVVSDARELSNIASVDATTVAALGAAGVGGGGSIELTAAESISAGKPVSINSSGQLINVTETAGAVSLQEQLQVFGGDITYHDTVFNPNANYTGHGNSDGVFSCFVKRTSSGQYTMEKRYSVNSTTGEIVSQGDQTWSSDSSEGYGIAVAYSPAIGAPTKDGRGLLILANISTNQLRHRSFYYNGLSVVQGSESNISHNYQGTQRIALVYDESLDFFVASATKSSAVLPVYVIELNSSGQSTNPATISVGFSGWTVNYKDPIIATDGNGQFLMMANDTGNGATKIAAFTLDSSYNASWGSTVQLSNITQLNDTSSMVYDEASGRFVISYGSNGSASTVIRTLTVSNNSMSFAAEATLQSSKRANSLVVGGPGNVGITYSTYSALFYKPVSIASNGSVTLGTAVQINNSSANSGWDSNRNFKTASTGANLSNFVSYVNFANYQYADLEGAEFAGSLTSNNTSSIGFASETIASGSAGDVTIVGGLNEQQSNLTPGSRYYISAAGALNTSDTGAYAGVATSSTNLLVKG